jgi:hypothetical protein
MTKKFTLTIAFLIIGSLFGQATAQSPQYVHNNTTLQANSNFNISGTGEANIFNARTQYNINGNRVLFTDLPNFNLFVGINTGMSITTARSNTIVGHNAGIFTTSGDSNSFFGNNAGFRNINGSENAFFGQQSGLENTSGQENAYFGTFSGRNTVTGRGNTFIGTAAGFNHIGGFKNTAIGAYANVGENNQFTTIIGAEAANTEDNSIQLGRIGFDIVKIGRLAPGDGSNSNLCLNANNAISLCSSSVRYKSNISNFKSGLDIINKLRPVSFNWRANDQFDLGLVAEEVAEIEPLLVHKNSDGNIEGVKYDRLGVLLINVVKEQQIQIENQNKTIESQSKKIDALMNFICSQNKSAKFCS